MVQRKNKTPQRIAVISQAGDAMKSLIAQALAVECANSKEYHSVAVADLDHEHRTTTHFVNGRKAKGITPTFNVYPVNNAQDALDCFNGERFQIIDTPSRATEAAIHIAEQSDLIVLPTQTGIKHTTLAFQNTFIPLLKKKVPVERIVFVFTRTGSRADFQSAFDELYNTTFEAMQNGIRVSLKVGETATILDQGIREQLMYRYAANDDYTITETTHKGLNNEAKKIIHQIFLSLDL